LGLSGILLDNSPTGGATATASARDEDRKIIDAFEKSFGIVILEGYGLTETASTTRIRHG
jgi:long-subunit acyl-CoA synthetase (AMP-forming)